MRKLFTLLIGVLFAGNAFGQYPTWTPIVNSDMESEDPDFVFFDARDYHESTDAQSSGRALIVEDPADPTNHCVKIVIRSEEQADAAGNKTLDWQSNFAGWDTQFFIVFKEPVPAGKQVRLTMRVKGENEDQFRIQMHRTASDYISEGTFPTQDVKYTSEWFRFSEKTTSPEDAFQSIAFNLSNGNANVLYLDDVKVEIKDAKEVDPNATIPNIDFFKGKGTQAAEEFEMNGRTYTTFTARDYVTGSDLQAEIVADPLDGQPALMIKAPDLTEVDDLDADGNQQTDDEGNIKKKNVFLRTVKDSQGNDSIAQIAPDDWLCQFFVTVNHKFVKGEKYKIHYWARAEKATGADGTAAAFDTQSHTYPGGYVHWACIGSQTLTDQWQEFKTGYDSDATMPNEVDGKNCQTIAFNLFKMKEANTYYFRFEEFLFAPVNVTDEDLTLASEDVQLKVDLVAEEDAATNIDLANMLATFNENDFSFIKNPANGDGMKFQVYEAPEEEGDDPTISLYTAPSLMDGAFLNAVNPNEPEQGYYVDGEINKGIQIYVDEDGIEGTVVPFKIYPDPEANFPFADGKVLNVKIFFVKGGWYYVLNATIGTEGALGIQGVKQVKADNGLIYNLAGQRVDASYKGLVIKNGQKSIQK